MAVFQLRYVRYMIVQHCDGRANGPMQKRYVLFAVQGYTLGDFIQAQYRGHQLIPAQTYFNTSTYDWSSSCHPVGLWPGEEHYSVFATTRRISRCFFLLLADTVIIIVLTPLSNYFLPVSILLPNERSGVISTLNTF